MRLIKRGEEVIKLFLGQNRVKSTKYIVILCTICSVLCTLYFILRTLKIKLDGKRREFEIIFDSLDTSFKIDMLSIKEIDNHI